MSSEASPPPSTPPRPARWRRIARWSLVVLCVLVTVASLTVAWFIRRSFPQVHGEITVQGLDGPVEVVRDIWGVPQIYADTSNDLFMAQGYVHAQDRFFEMDFRRHVTSGRLSEMFGESQVETDASIRTMGWRATAEEEWDLLDPATKDYFTSYAAGVNAFLADKSPDDVSLEYTMLGLTGLDYEIEEWDPVDSLAWLKAMAWDLRGNYSDELNRAYMAASGLSTDAIAELYPEYPSDLHTPIVPEGTVVDGEFDQDATAEPDERVSTVSTPDDVIDAVSSALDATGAIDAVIGAGGADGIGSNSWVVSGDRTDTGLPILANDPHLGPAMPSVWYQAGLRCTTVSAECPFDVAGFSFAGVPGIMIGHNGDIAWGFTNLGPDVTDFYYERVDGDRYLVGDEWRDMEVREEEIEVAGGDPVTITIRETLHGPVMSDRGGDPESLAAEAPANLGVEDEGDYAMSLRWTALDPGRTADAIFAMNAASDFTEFRAAAALFEVPAQNLIYADTDGTIAYQSPGRIPIRGEGDGTFPAPGWDPDYDWTGFIPFEELPVVENPDEGFIVTANNEVIADQYPHLLTNDWAYGYRSQRIRDMIAEHDGPITVDAMHRMQLDSANEGAVPIIEAVRRLDFTGVEAEAVALLDGWDLQQPADSAPAAFYNALWRNLLINSFGDELPEGRPPGGGERWAYVVSRIIGDDGNAWWDDVSTSETETRDDQLAASVTDAIAELSELIGDDPASWEWGELHTLTVTHQTLGTSGIGFVEAMFNADPITTSGGDGLVNATGWNAAVDYTVDAVPSMRMVVDLSDFDNSQWINLTGASGHAFNSHYADQLPLWQEGKMLPMYWSKENFASESGATLWLRP